MRNKPSLPRGSWKRLLASWLLTSAVFLGAIAFFLTLGQRYYVWSWLVYGPPRPPELKAGDLAPDFTLRDLKGTPFHLAEEVLESPVVVEIGSFS